MTSNLIIDSFAGRLRTLFFGTAQLLILNKYFRLLLFILLILIVRFNLVCVSTIRSNFFHLQQIGPIDFLIENQSKLYFLGSLLRFSGVKPFWWGIYGVQDEAEGIV